MKQFVLKGRGLQPEYRIPYAQELNEEQLAVVMAGDGPVLVIAGAGTGKTRTLTYRVARLVESQVPPEGILLLTFTNKAAREMLARVEGLLGTGSLRIVGGTFHHVGNLLLRRFAPLLGFPHAFTILDRGDGRDLMRSVLASLHLDKDKRLPGADMLVGVLSFAVNTMRPLADVVAERYPQWLEMVPEIERLLVAYQEKKKAIGAMDYDDLLLYWLTLMREHADVGRELQGRYRHLLVDEYQDTNKLQGLLIDAMAAEHGNVTVVGDDAQSIYAFRGAHHENIMTFPERYQGAQVYRLVTNYRSQPAILELANRSIALNTRQFPKELKAVRPPGGKPLVARCRDVYQQAALVSEYVLGLLDEGRDLDDIAVLYRANFQSLEIQAELTRRHIPYMVFGGIRFFEQAHIKDVVSYLRVLTNPKDELAWLRLLPLLPKMGQKTAMRVAELLRGSADPATDMLGERLPAELPKPARRGFEELQRLLRRLLERRDAAPGDLLNMVLEGSYLAYLEQRYPNWRNRKEDLQQLMAFASGYGKLDEFLAELALLGSTQSETVLQGAEREGSLTLTTVHQAKGLEWPCVIVAGLSDGAFPSSLALREAEGEEEERRLFYVACTRAKDELLLTFPSARVVRGQGLVLQRPSRFVTELPPSCREEMEVREGGREPAPLPAAARALPPSPADDGGFADPEISDEAWFQD